MRTGKKVGRSAATGAGQGRPIRVTSHANRTEIASAAIAAMNTLPNWSAFQPRKTATAISRGSNPAWIQTEKE